MEQLILKFKLPMLETTGLALVRCIVTMGFNKTGNKFSVDFNGSKGYLSNVVISCEGVQKANNRIMIEQLEGLKQKLKPVMVEVYHSEENGVRVITVNN